MLYKRIQDLGGKPIIRRGDGDDQHPLGLDWELEKWLQELWERLLTFYPMPPGLELLQKKQLYP